MIDLHCHSVHSDGTDTPEHLLALAEEAGVQAIAITDHDSLDGFDLAKAKSCEFQTELICGVEIGTHLSGCIRSVHLLGYFPAEPGASFRRWLHSLKESRISRNVRLMDRLRNIGIELTWEELHALSPHQLGRPHFARVLMQRGYVSSIRDAFSLYLSESGCAWTEREEPSIEEALSGIIEAGGIASLAHPVRISSDIEKIRQIIARLVPQGLEAVECYHPEHSDQVISQLLHIASEFRLRVTGGSDYHGENKPGIRMGWTGDEMTVPDELLESLRAGFDSRRIGADMA